MGDVMMHSIPLGTQLIRTYPAMARLRRYLLLLSLPWFALACVSLRAQDSGVAPVDISAGSVVRFTSLRDSVDWDAARRRAELARGFKVIIDINERRLYAVEGADTLLNTQVAVGRGTTLNFEGKKWVFKTPRGTRTVQSKNENPVWVPPEWHYVELAQERGFKVRTLKANTPVMLKDGSWLELRGTRAGVTPLGSTEWKELPLDEEIVFDNTIFIPPIGSDHRRVEGQLGKYSLKLGDGYMLHGTPHQWSIGTAASHGCIRMRDEDIAWLFENVQPGTKVYIF
jgi:hypothetical protein